MKKFLDYNKGYLHPLWIFLPLTIIILITSSVQEKQEKIIHFENYTKPKIEATAEKASWYEITGYCLNKNPMASGKEVYSGAVACPAFLKLGIKVKIKGREYTCEDRMAKKYRDGNYIDIWFKDCADAINWGRRKVEVYIVK